MKYKVETKMAQIWFDESGKVVDRDDWEEVHSVSVQEKCKCVAEAIAIAKVETKMARKYESNNNEYLFTMSSKIVA